MHKLFKLLCNIFLITTALSPFVNLEIPDWEKYFTSFRIDGSKSVNIGIHMAESERDILIKEGLETYILSKAADMGYQINVEMVLDSDGIPLSVRMKGYLPSAEQRKLSNIITNDLGIPEADQQWIGENGRNLS